MRFRWAVAGVVSALGALVACSNSSGGSTPADAGSVCSDSLVNVFNDNPGVACPVDANGNPLSYDQAITRTCSQEKLKTGDVQYGQCLDYLVWEVDVDASGHDFTKCFYDVKSHALVGLVYADGMQDQCGGSSYTVQGGSAEAYCTISGQSAGGGGNFVSCAPVVDAGGQ